MAKVVVDDCYDFGIFISFWRVLGGWRATWDTENQANKNIKNTKIPSTATIVMFRSVHRRGNFLRTRKPFYHVN